MDWDGSAGASVHGSTCNSSSNLVPKRATLAAYLRCGATEGSAANATLRPTGLRQWVRRVRFDRIRACCAAWPSNLAKNHSRDSLRRHAPWHGLGARAHPGWAVGGLSEIWRPFPLGRVLSRRDEFGDCGANGGDLVPAPDSGAHGGSASQPASKFSPAQPSSAQPASKSADVCMRVAAGGPKDTRLDTRLDTRTHLRRDDGGSSSGEARISSSTASIVARV